MSEFGTSIDGHVIAVDLVANFKWQCEEAGSCISLDQLLVQSGGSERLPGIFAIGLGRKCSVLFFHTVRSR